MNVIVHAEDIMTPRRLLKHAVDDDTAQAAARNGGFDAIPILYKDGSVHEFWSRADRKRMRITRHHRISHDSTVERRAVKLGAADGERVVVLAGVTPGERVAIGDFTRLKDGAEIRIEP